MYIRIQDNSIKFRVSQSEAKKLVDCEPLENSINLSNDYTLIYAIKVTKEENDYHYIRSLNSIQLLINKAELQSEILKRPTKKGILFHKTINGRLLTISLEIDLKKIRL